ncbi:putative amino acid permease 7 [Glycine soja]
MAVQNSLQITRSGSGGYDDDGRAKRTGTLWSAVAHIITAIIGAGVLSLAWSTSQLGWIAGPVCLLFCAIVTYVSSFLLSDCYRTLDPVTVKRNYSYMDAVRVYLGNKRTWLAGSLQYLSLYGVSTAYFVTCIIWCFFLSHVILEVLVYLNDICVHVLTMFGLFGLSTKCRAILKSNCYHKEGHQAPCKYGDVVYMMLFGLVQVIMSFIPDLHNMAWVSIVAAIMSFTYSSIGLGLGITTVIENGRIMGSLTGVPASNIADKLWLVFQAIGDIAFAYPYTVILLEIQDTLESPPPENKTMKKASMIAILITTFFYLCCGCFGYAAFGNQTPGNLLTGFGFYEPYWLIDFANACIVLHLVGGYQIYSQPIYGAVDRWCSKRYPNSGFVNNFYQLKLPRLPAFQLNMFRICFRTTYVVSTTGLAILFPYFNQVIGVLGALGFWPLAIYFPVEMYFVQRKIEAWSRKWIVLRTFSFICFLVSLVALIGSLEGIISEKLS